MTNPAVYLKCMQCNWQGTLAEVDWDTVDTCMGQDKIEVCPKCGSMEINIHSDLPDHPNLPVI